MTEKEVKKQIHIILKRIDAWYFMPSQTGIGRRAVPDFVGILHGGSGFGLEVKGTGGQVTKTQAYELAWIRHAGGFAEFIYPQDLSGLEDRLKAFIRGHS